MCHIEHLKAVAVGQPESGRRGRSSATVGSRCLAAKTEKLYTDQPGSFLTADRKASIWADSIL